MTRMLFVCAVIFIAAPQSFARNKDEYDPDLIGHRDVARGVNFYSITDEIALGKDMAQEVELESHVLNDAVVSEYVNRLGQNIVRNSDATVPFTIKVLDSDDVNAFALPGGFLYVNSGLILKAANEAELAGVLAHEIAHVAARHGTRQATRGELLDYATIALVFAGGWAGYVIREAAGFAIPLGFLKFSRGMESEADLLGLEYMYKTGYDPNAMLDFFEKLQTADKHRPGTIAAAFSSHPMTGTRIRDTQRNIQKVLKPQPQYVLDTSEFQSVKMRLSDIERRHDYGNNFSLRHRVP